MDCLYDFDGEVQTDFAGFTTLGDGDGDGNGNDRVCLLVNFTLPHHSISTLLLLLLIAKKVLSIWKV